MKTKNDQTVAKVILMTYVLNDNAPSLTKAYIEKISSFLKGKRLDKFLTSIECIEKSLEHGSWIKGMSRKADSGFYQGLLPTIPDKPHELKRALSYGSTYNISSFENDYKIMKDYDLEANKRKTVFLKTDIDVIKSWILLANEAKKAISWLNSARPVPVITQMGLSPTVLKTIHEMGLTETISTIKYPKLEKVVEKYTAKNRTTGEMEEYTYIYFVPVFEDNCLHSRSRFYGVSPSGHKRCHACGHAVPSGRMVPLEACDKSGQWYSMYLGTDCAKSLFGVIDIGVSVNVEEEIKRAKQMAESQRKLYLEEQGRL